MLPLEGKEMFGTAVQAQLEKVHPSNRGFVLMVGLKEMRDASRGRLAAAIAVEKTLARLAKNPVKKGRK